MKNQITIFVSSTFHYMDEERDTLVTYVFPELRDRLRKINWRLWDIDLRWGVLNEENGKETNKWHYCKRAIDRDPDYIIVLLGDWYGTHQPKENFLEDDFAKMPELLAIAGNKSLTDIEIRYATKNFKDERTKIFFYSKATDAHEVKGRVEEHEILLKEVEKYAIAFNRPFRTYLSENHQDGSTDRLEGLGEVIVEDLWTAILADHVLPQLPPHRWSLRDQAIPYGSWFSQSDWERIVDLLRDKQLVDAEWDPVKIEIAYFRESKNLFFRGRKPEFDHFEQFMENRENRVCYIYGEGGIGKTTLIAKLNEIAENRARENRWEYKVISFYAGVSDKHNSKLDLFESVIKYCDAKFRLELGQQELSAEGKFTELLTNFDSKSNGKLLILIDAINQLEDGKDLDWIPTSISPSVKIVLSSTVDPKMSDLDRLKLESIKVTPLGKSEIKGIIQDFLAEYSKELHENQIDFLTNLPQCGNPLYLQVLLNELRTEGEVTEKRALSFRGGEVALKEIGTKFPNLEYIFDWVLEKVEKHFGVEESRLWFSLMLLARPGLLDRELATLMELNLENPRKGIAYRIQRYVRDYLKWRGQNLDFYHEQFRMTAEKRYLHAEAQKGYIQQCHIAISELFENNWNLKSADSLGSYNALRGLAYHYRLADLKDKLFGLIRNQYFLDKQAKSDVNLIKDTALQGVMAGLEGQADEWRAKELVECLMLPFQRKVIDKDDSPLRLYREKGFEEALAASRAFPPQIQLQWLLLIALDAFKKERKELVGNILERIANSFGFVLEDGSRHWHEDGFWDNSPAQHIQLHTWIAHALAEFCADNDFAPVAIRIQSQILNDDLKFRFFCKLDPKCASQWASTVLDQIKSPFYHLLVEIDHLSIKGVGLSDDQIHELKSKIERLGRQDKNSAVRKVAFLLYQSGRFEEAKAMTRELAPVVSEWLEFLLVDQGSSKVAPNPAPLELMGQVIQHLYSLREQLNFLTSSEKKEELLGCLNEIFCDQDREDVIASLHRQGYLWDNLGVFWDYENELLFCFRNLLRFDFELAFKTQSKILNEVVRTLAFSEMVAFVGKAFSTESKLVELKLFDLVFSQSDQFQLMLGMAMLASLEKDASMKSGLFVLAEAACFPGKDVGCRYWMRMRFELGKIKAAAGDFKGAINLALSIRMAERNAQLGRPYTSIQEREYAGFYHFLLKEIALVADRQKNTDMLDLVRQYVYPAYRKVFISHTRAMEKDVLDPELIERVLEDRLSMDEGADPKGAQTSYLDMMDFSGGFEIKRSRLEEYLLFLKGLAGKLEHPLASKMTSERAKIPSVYLFRPPKRNAYTSLLLLCLVMMMFIPLYALFLDVSWMRFVVTMSLYCPLMGIILWKCYQNMFAKDTHQWWTITKQYSEVLFDSFGFRIDLEILRRVFTRSSDEIDHESMLKMREIAPPSPENFPSQEDRAKSFDKTQREDSFDEHLILALNGATYRKQFSVAEMLISYFQKSAPGIVVDDFTRDPRYQNTWNQKPLNQETRERYLHAVDIFAVRLATDGRISQAKEKLRILSGTGKIHYSAALRAGIEVAKLGNFKTLKNFLIQDHGLLTPNASLSNIYRILTSLDSEEDNALVKRIASQTGNLSFLNDIDSKIGKNRVIYPSLIPEQWFLWRFGADDGEMRGESELAKECDRMWGGILQALSSGDYANALQWAADIPDQESKCLALVMVLEIGKRSGKDGTGWDLLEKNILAEFQHEETLETNILDDWRRIQKDFWAHYPLAPGRKNLLVRHYILYLLESGQVDKAKIWVQHLHSELILQGLTAGFGFALIKSGKVEESIREFRQIHSIKANYLPTLFGRLVDIKAGLSDAALQELKQLIFESFNSIHEVYSLCTGLCYFLPQEAQVEDVLSQMMIGKFRIRELNEKQKSVIDPKFGTNAELDWFDFQASDLNAHLLVAYLHQKSKNHAQALLLFGRAFNIANRIFDRFHIDFLETHNEDFKRLIKSNLDSLSKFIEPYYFNQVQCLSELGLYDEAIEGYRSLKKTSQVSLIHWNLEMAVSMMDLAVQNPDSQVDLNELMTLLEGCLVEIIRQERLGNHHPDQKSSCLFYLGLFAGRLGLIESAIIITTQAINIDPQTHFAHHNLGVWYQRAKDLEASLRHFRKHEYYFPEEPLTQVKIMEILLMQGDYDDLKIQIQLCETTDWLRKHQIEFDSIKASLLWMEKYKEEFDNAMTALLTKGEFRRGDWNSSALSDFLNKKTAPKELITILQSTSHIPSQFTSNAMIESAFQRIVDIIGPVYFYD